MAEAPRIEIDGRKRLRTIHKEFQAQYPYLGLGFLTHEQWEKARAAGGTVSLLDDDKKLAEVRTKPPSTGENKEISIDGRTKVKSLEDNFLRIYGLHLLVGYMKGGKRYYTGGDMAEMSLNQLNKKLEEDGCTKNPPTTSGK